MNPDDLEIELNRMKEKTHLLEINLRDLASALLESSSAESQAKIAAVLLAVTAEEKLA